MRHTQSKTSHDQWGLWCNAIGDWLMEDRKTVAVWSTEKEADSYRKNHTVHKEMYEVRKIND
jgi:hypothetical protein